MKRSVKYCCIIVIIGILLGIYTFILFNSGFIYINPDSFGSFYFTLIVTSAALLITLMKLQLSNCEGRMKKAYCCCGNLAAIGAVGTIILAFLTSLSECGCDFQFYAGVSLIFFFLVLMLGGIVCFLYTLNGCHSECIPEKTECRVDDEYYTRDYNKKDYMYRNNTNNRR